MEQEGERWQSILTRIILYMGDRKITRDFSREMKVLINSGSERPVVPVETPALAGSMKQESLDL